MENGFDSLLVSEGQLTVGLKAISAAQDGAVGRQNADYRPLARRFDDSRTANYREQAWC